MKKRVRKLILLTEMLCAIGLAVCACGDTKGESADVADLEAQTQEENDPVSDEDSETETFMAEPETDKEDTGTDEKTPDVDEETKSSEDKTDTDETQDIKPDVENVSGTWIDSTPNLEGDIKDIWDGQFTVIEAITGKSDNGGDVIVLPSAGGDDSEYNKVIVTYDENTLFAVKMIYDGGARSEMKETTSSSLAADQLVEVWGDSSGSELKATQICIVKVI
ncbi:MAG: hypothetical protein HDR04_05180 [Lachnospiraceae bacterium]|nr:hypothetical protein [Lachnospiraceae bacterium]